MNKDKYDLSLKLEKVCRTNKEDKIFDFMQAVSKTISRLQNTHTFSLEYPLDRRTNA